MTTTRRRFVQGSAAAAMIAGAPAIGRAQGTPSPAKTLKCVMQGDLRSFDPIWTTANITAYHGMMIYDTLFGLDPEETQAADGRHLRGERRQARLDVQAARRAEVH